jgi:ribosomal protein L11
MAFCKEYNAATAKMAGEIVPVEITVYEASVAGVYAQQGVAERRGTSMTSKMHGQL